MTPFEVWRCGGGLAAGVAYAAAPADFDAWMERLALAAEGANDGLWQWDLRTQEFYVSGRWRAMMGLYAGAGIGQLEEWLERVHPDDVAGLKDTMKAYLAGQTDVFLHEHRIRHEDGARRLNRADVLRVTVTGHGGHAAMPHDAVDPVPAAAAIVGALQTMITRRTSVFDPVVLTIAHIVAGTTTNIIPETALLEGTIRTLSEETRAHVHEQVRLVCTNVAAAYGCTADVDLEKGYPVTVNDDRVGPRVIELAERVLGEEFGTPMPTPMMGAEDFSYVLQQVPGVMAFVGACPPGIDPDQAEPNHSNRVVFDEPAMAHGVAMYAAFALDALGARG